MPHLSSTEAQRSITLRLSMWPATSCRMLTVALSLLGCLAFTAVGAQPFTFTPGPFQPELTEADQRPQDNYTGFVFDFSNATVSVRSTRHICLACCDVALRIHQHDELPHCSIVAAALYVADGSMGSSAPAHVGQRHCNRARYSVACCCPAGLCHEAAA